MWIQSANPKSGAARASWGTKGQAGGPGMAHPRAAWHEGMARAWQDEAAARNQLPSHIGHKATPRILAKSPGRGFMSNMAVIYGSWPRGHKATAETQLAIPVETQAVITPNPNVTVTGGFSFAPQMLRGKGKLFPLPAKSRPK